MRFMPEPGSPLDRLFTLMLANLLWVGLSILVIPLPAATAALFAVVAPWVRNQDVELFGTFFGTMRRQWRKSTVIALADGVAAAILIVNFRILALMNLDNTAFLLIQSVYIFVAVVALMVNIYLWPLLVLFDLPLKRLLNLSWRFAFAHLLWSGFVLALVALLLFVSLLIPMLFMMLAMFALIALVVNWGAWRIIRNYATPEELAALEKPYQR